RHKELLSKVMAMHKDSEDMNDPSCLSAVLHMYELLRLHEWEKVRSSIQSCWKYKHCTVVFALKKLFDACEKDTEDRTAHIAQVLHIPPSNDTMGNSKQVMMREIRNMLRRSYNQNHTELYSKIVMKTGIDAESPILQLFMLQCCRVYCLLLLQDPPVKAEWSISGTSVDSLEHVNKK
ncbi:hypothetical protein N310_08273, partial [Acanthisitta chloris]